MRHVDDGTLHAWLDEELPSAEAAPVAAHLDTCAACRARLDDARAVRDRAGALLEIDMPDVERPPFDRLVALADARARGQVDDEVPPGPVRAARGWLLAAGWAASVMLAVGLGWAARDMTSRAPQRPDMTVAVDGAATAGEERMEARLGAQRADGASTSTADAAPPGRSVPAVLPAPASMSPEATATERQADEPAARRDQVEMADDVQSQTLDRRTQPARTPFSGAPAPAAPAPSLPAPAALPIPAAAPSPVPARDMQAARAAEAAGRRPDAAAVARAPVPDTTQAATLLYGAGDLVVWQPVPRTEAAARTGMALYGIDGLEAIDTAVSSDARQVRTRYRLASGDVVTLVQQQMPSSQQDVIRGELPSVEFGRASTFAARTGGGTAASPLVRSGRPGAETWTTVRGEVWLTLETAGTDATPLPALGARLRID